jgi:hypothetical protein
MKLRCVGRSLTPRPRLWTASFACALRNDDCRFHNFAVIPAKAGIHIHRTESLHELVVAAFFATTMAGAYGSRLARQVALGWDDIAKGHDPRCEQSGGGL